MPRRFGLVGYKASGKTTLARALESKHMFTRLSFADPVKAEALKMVQDFCWRNATGDMNIPQTVDDLKALPGGVAFIQCVGTDLGRNSFGYEDIWVDKMASTIEAHASEPIVVDDVRFPNELALLRREGFEIIRVIRSGNDRWRHLIKTNPNLTAMGIAEMLNHDSEKHVNTMEVDLDIQSLSVDQLELSVASALVQYESVELIENQFPWSTWDVDYEDTE